MGGIANGPERPANRRGAAETRKPGPRRSANRHGFAQSLSTLFQPPSFMPGHRRRPGNRHTDGRSLVRPGLQRSAANRLIERVPSVTHPVSPRHRIASGPAPFRLPIGGVRNTHGPASARWTYGERRASAMAGPASCGAGGFRPHDGQARPFGPCFCMKLKKLDVWSRGVLDRV